MNAENIGDPRIHAALAAAITDECRRAPENLTRTMTSAAIAGWDSLAHVRIMMNLEARLGVSIDIAKTYRMANLGALVDHIAENLPASPGRGPAP